MKNLLLIQPGPFGDIFVCAPIAKWYADSGYKVHWPITKKFESTLEKFDYVTPIILSDEVFHADWLRSDVMKILPTVGDYDKVINLADRGPHPTAQRPNEE
jgi:UDP:flavonoid glycosyltransferase YjiC (YdhE family)